MKSKYILSSALSLAIVGASIVSPFSYADESYYQYFTAKIDQLNQQIQSTLAKATTMLIDNNTAFSGNLSMCSFGIDNSIEVFLPCGNLTVSSSSVGGSNEVAGVYLPYIVHQLSNDEYYVRNGRYYFNYSSSGLYLPTGAYYSYSNGRLDWLCLPTGYYDSSGVLHANSSVNTPYLDAGIFQKQLINSGNFANNSQAVQDFIYQDNPKYTTPAPGFPNLPDNWVNGGGDIDIKIDLPDVDFNLPDLPDYTLPDAPTIPEQFKTNINTILGKCWDFIVQSGLTWLVILSLTCSLIIFIFSR